MTSRRTKFIGLLVAFGFPWMSRAWSQPQNNGDAPKSVASFGNPALRHLQGSPRRVQASPDGKWVASASPEEVILWNAETKQSAWRRVGRVDAIAFSSDSKKLALAEYDDASERQDLELLKVDIRVYDRQTEKASLIGSIPFSGRGIPLSIGWSLDDSCVRVLCAEAEYELDVASRKAIQKSDFPDLSKGGSFTASRNCGYLAHVSYPDQQKKCVFTVWKCGPPKIHAQVATPDDPGVSELALSPDGDLLAFGKNIWSLSKKERIGALPAEVGRPEKLAFSADGSRLAVTSGRDVSIVALPSLQILHRLPGHSAHSSAISFSDSGGLLASAGGNAIRLHTLGRLLNEAPDHEDEILRLHFGSGGRELYVADRSRWVSSWSLENKERRSFWRVEPQQGDQVAQWSRGKCSFADVGKSVYLCSGYSFRIQVLDCSTTKEIAAFPAKFSNGSVIAPGGSLVAFTSQSDGFGETNLCIGDVASGKVIASSSLGEGKTWDHQLQFVNKSRNILFASSQELASWNVKSLTLDKVIESEWTNASSLSSSADGSVIACMSSSGQCLTWPPGRGLSTHRKEVITSADVSSTGIIAMGTHDGRIQLSRLHNGKRAEVKIPAGKVEVGIVQVSDKREWTAHRGPVTAVAFSSDERYLATAGNDTTVHVWELK